MSDLEHLFRRCRWCNRILVASANPEDERYERPHCAVGRTCDWGKECLAKPRTVIENDTPTT